MKPFDFRCRGCNILMIHKTLDSQKKERVRWECDYCELPDKAYEDIYLKIRWARNLEELNQAGEMVTKANIPKESKEYRALINTGFQKRQELS